MAYLVLDDLPICSEETVGPHITPLFEAPCLEVFVINENGVSGPGTLAGYLTKNEVISFLFCDN